MKKDIFMIRIPYLIGLRSFLSSVLFVFFLFESFSQEINQTRWYFGNSAENLIFDRDARDVYLQTDQATPFGAAGAVTITDQFTGNLLFYSDGVNLFDVNHNLVPLLAGGLSGDPSINVPVVTCPVTDNAGQYYLFTNTGAEIQYSVVDANLPGNGTDQFPYGDLVTGMINQSTGIGDPAEGMLIIAQGDGELFWLVTQDRNTFEIRVTQVDGDGIGTTNSFDFTNGGNPGFEASHFAFNGDSLLAVAPKTANRNLWLLNFDTNNGNVQLDSVITGTGFDDGANESIYDLEWSPNSSKLYISRFGGAGATGQVYQLDFVDSTTTGMIQPILPDPVFRSYGLQRAIDNRIYHLYQETDVSSPFLLGRINQPDSLVDSVAYQPVVFPENFNATQFPQFTPAYNFTFDNVSFFYIDSCATNVTKFFPLVEPIPNSVSWDFGMAGGSDQWIPTLELPADPMGQTSFIVSLTVEVAGIDSTFSEFVEIFANDLMVDLGNDTTICVDEVLQLDAGMGASFVWSTGETTQTIEVDTTGTYWVEVTNAAGCTDFDDIEVLEYGVVEQIYNQWYFGEQAGIDFNTGLAILDGNNQEAEEGCATISDVNGDLLFYTNGVTVWNRDHEVMVNGDSIGGDLQSAQNSLIMPFGGDETMFYIFTTEQVYGDSVYSLKYSIVDMKEDTAMGKVIIKDVRLMENSSERITGSGFTGNDLIVAREFGNNSYRTFRTSDLGLSAPVFSPGGEIHDFMNELSATGYMKISPTFNQIAVLIPGTNQVEILDFDQGVVSNPRLIDVGDANLYGLEFSPSGNRLYLTTSTNLIQYDLDSLDSQDPATDIEATRFDGYAPGTGYGALQIGPDGIIYMAVDNSGTIGTITAPDGDDVTNGFNSAGFDLQGRISRLGLPNFAQIENTPTQEPTITVTPGCVGQTSTFSAVGRDPNNSIENYLWVFGDGASASVQDTTHIYTEPGTYNVQMILSNRCDTDTVLTTTITVNVIPELPTVPTDTAICDGPIVLEAWPEDNPDFTYQWSTGETTRQITVSEPAVIDITITNITTGCPSETVTVFVANAAPDVDLGNDRVFCQDDTPEVLDSDIVNATAYQWFIDGVPSGTNRTLEASTAVSGDFEYVVEVTNTLGCVGRDTLQVSVLAGPDVDFVGNATTGCGDDNGYIELTFNQTGSYSYEISGPANRGPFNFDGPGTVAIPAGAAAPGDGDLPPGNYNLMLTNLVTGCVRNEVVQVEDLGNLGMAATAPRACNGEGAISINFSLMTPNSFDIVIDYEDGSNELNTSLSNAFTNPVLQNLDTGTYFITVTDTDPAGLGCVETDTVRIQLENPEPGFTFDTPQFVCGSEGEIFIVGVDSLATTLFWTGPGIVGQNTNDTITVNQPGTYTVLADGPNFCPRSEEIEVRFNNDPIVDIEIQGDPCEGEVTLLANVSNGSGSYVFSWSNGTLSGANTVTTSGTYFVTVTDQLTGCDLTSSDVVITVEEEFEVELTLDADCDNNGQVFVIATTTYFDPSITYQWQDGAGNILSDVDSILTVTASDTYTVTATNETGTCVVTDVIDVAVVPINPEDLLLRDRETFCRADLNNPTVVLDPGIFNTYEWRLLPDTTVISRDPTLEVADAGTYEVTLYNGFTCIIDQVEVDEDCRPVIFAPNAFTPGDGNGRNDEFFVFPNDFVDDFEILIYTRWGEPVFRSENQDFRWNGVYRGQLLPPGTYAYILKFSSSLAPELGTIEQYGAVTLIR